MDRDDAGGAYEWNESLSNAFAYLGLCIAIIYHANQPNFQMSRGQVGSRCGEDLVKAQSHRCCMPKYYSGKLRLGHVVGSKSSECWQVVRTETGAERLCSRRHGRLQTQAALSLGGHKIYICPPPPVATVFCVSYPDMNAASVSHVLSLK